MSGLNKFDFSDLFNPFVYNKVPSLAFYLDKKESRISPVEILSFFEKTIKQSLKRIVCIQYKLSTLSEKFSSSDNYQSSELFFSLPCFESEFSSGSFPSESEIAVLYRELGIDTYQEKDCIDALKQYSITIGNHRIQSGDMDLLNKVLKFVGSDLMVIDVSVEGRYSIFLAECKPFGQYDRALWVTEEYLSSPSVQPTLAAFTFHHKIFLRKKCFEFMMEMKWDSLYQKPSQIASLSVLPEYAISDFFKEFAVKGLSELAQADFREQVMENVGTNVFFHEFGHIVASEYVETETAAMMKKLVLLGCDIFNSSDECLADFAPVYKENMGTLLSISHVAKTDPAQATRLFYTYASDTWFFDTSEESMFEYSEMFHLVMLRYISLKDGSIAFEQMQKDFDFENPRSFLTIFVSTINSLMDEFRALIKTLTCNIDGELLTYRTVMKVSREKVLENSPLIDTKSYDYYTFLWDNILYLYSTYGVERSVLDNFFDGCKERLYKILFRLSTKKVIAYPRARSYIMQRYKKILDLHGYAEQPFI